MAFSAGGGGGVRSDINVTPLVDVVLVLLIIFLIAMPIEMKDITIDIPKKAPEDQPIPDIIPDQITVAIQKGGTITINDQEVNKIDFAQRLKERLDRKREKVVFVDFDDEARYGDVVGLMDLVKGAGATTVALKMKDKIDPSAPAPAPATP
jgi:biopolymer transport protein TolR